VTLTIRALQIVIPLNSFITNHAYILHVCKKIAIANRRFFSSIDWIFYTCHMSAICLLQTWQTYNVVSRDTVK